MWAFGFGVFLLALLLRLACFTGLIGSDDLSYSGYAQLIANGQYVPEYHHRAIRYGVLLPVGLTYKLFGLSEWSTIAVPLVASSLSVVLLGLIANKLFGGRTALVAALLLATFPLQLRYATVLLPEPILACYVLAAVFIYVHTEDRAPLARGVLTGVFIGLGYLSKEPALFVAPALILDAALRRRWRHAFGVAIGVVAVVALEHAYYVTMSGDLLFRPHALARHNRNVSQVLAQGLARAKADIGVDAERDLFRTLFVQYPRKMLVPNVDFGIHSVAALLVSAVAAFWFRMDRRARFLLLWASLPWLYLNFGTSSFSQYVTIPRAPRTIDLSYPPLFVFSAWLVTDLLRRAPWTRRLAMPAIAAVLIVGVVCGLSTRATEYRTDQVAVLRGIANTVAEKDLGGVCFDADPVVQSRWQRALVILTGNKLQPCDGSPTRVILREDRLGFPYVASRAPLDQTTR